MIRWVAAGAVALLLGAAVTMGGNDDVGSEGTETTQPGPPPVPGPTMATPEVKLALAAVLLAENEHYETNNEYTDEHDSESGELVGVDVLGVTDWGLAMDDDKHGVVYFWRGTDSEPEIEGALYLGVRAENGICYYLRAASPSNVVTAIDTHCPSAASVEYGASEWALP